MRGRSRSTILAVGAVGLWSCSCAGSDPNDAASIGGTNAAGHGEESASAVEPTTTTRRRCPNDWPPTVGNTVIAFLVDVQAGRDPAITGGVDDPFGCAYDRLCDELRTGVPEAEFRHSEGAAVSRVLTADSHEGPSVYDDRGLAQELPDDQTTALDLAASWIEVNATWYEHIDDRTVVAGSEEPERWRIDVVREDGDWRLCSFTPAQT